MGNIFFTVTKSILIIAAILTANISAQAEEQQTVSSSSPQIGICFLSGTVNDPSHKSKGFESLGNNIRLKFDAVTTEECKIQFINYCTNQVRNAGYLVGKLSGYFQEKNKTQSRVNLIVNRDCSVAVTKPES